jgi:Type II secretory pathway, component PulM
MKQWWQRLMPRERWLVLTGTAVLLVFLLYRQGWVPLQQQLQHQQKQVVQLQQQLQWMRQQAPLIRQLKQSTPSSKRTDDIASVLSATSHTYQIIPRRIQPQGENGALIETDALPFEQLLNWLDMLEQQYGIAVQQIELQPAGKPGYVLVKRLLLGRNKNS